MAKIKPSKTPQEPGPTDPMPPADDRIDTGLVAAAAFIPPPEEAPAEVPEEAQTVEIPAPAPLLVRPHGTLRDEFMRQVEEHRKPKPVRKPDPPTVRQTATTKAEMAAGAARVSEFAVIEKNRPKAPPRQVSEGYTTPVYRPTDGAGSKDRNPERLRSG
jgi:hypothetical protein